MYITLEHSNVVPFKGFALTLPCRHVTFCDGKGSSLTRAKLASTIDAPLKCRRTLRKYITEVLSLSYVVARSRRRLSLSLSVSLRTRKSGRPWSSSSLWRWQDHLILGVVATFMRFSRAWLLILIKASFPSSRCFSTPAHLPFVSISLTALQDFRSQHIFLASGFDTAISLFSVGEFQIVLFLGVALLAAFISGNGQTQQTESTHVCTDVFDTAHCN